jgi:hypothetical protein
MQEALIEAMKFDIEEGNFFEVLLDKLDEDEKKKTTNSSPSASLMQNGLDKSQFHESHSKIYNDNLQIEIDTLE